MVKTKQKKRVTADVLTTKKTATKVKKHNPFEVHTNKEKFTIMGRQLKHDRGMPGVSRAKALQRRRDTLGQEYLQQNKANAFRDRRIGETTMTREEAASARFIAERLNQQKANRKESLFNLNDDDEAADLLTHKGQTLGEIEQFQDTVSDDGEDDDEVMGKLDDQYTGAAHFGGGADAADAESRKSAIKDLIADQKRRKQEISKEKEEVSDLTQQLDENWKTLIPLMAKMSKEDEKKPKPDAYDRALREMVFEPRGDVSDKLKSVAEVVRGEKERLERLERERLERMSGVTEEEKKAKHRSADDLDDGYFVQPVVEEKGTLAYDINDKAKKKADSDSDDEDPFASVHMNGKASKDAEDDEEDEDGEEESGEEDEDAEEGSEEEGSDDDDDDDDDDDNDSLNDLRATDSESEETPAVAENAGKRRLAADTADSVTAKKPKTLTEAERQASMRQAAAELPYTFELPDTYDELEEVLRNRNAEFQSVIIERMIKCNHPKIVHENKARMVTLFGYLLQHINDTFETATAATVASSFHVLDRLCPHLYDLSVINPAETTQCFKEVVKEKQSDFRGAQVKRYPSLDTLVFLKLAASLYSTSDYRHHIITPCYIFASELLSRCRVTSRSDVASGLFVVTILLEYAQLSKRFVPAALNFLAGVIFLALRKRPVEVLRVVPPFSSTGEHNSLLAVSSDSKLAKRCTDTRLNVSDLVQAEFDDASRVRLLHTALQLQSDTLTLLADNIGVQYFADHIEQHLSRLDLQPYPEFVRQAAAECQTAMQTLRSKPLAYIMPAAKKPKALRLLEPAFEKVYDDKRSRKPGNKDKLVREGMMRKIKSETRGAIREIRRDNAFIANIQLKKQMRGDAERREKVRRIFSEASIQQGELNAMERKKKHM